MIIILDTTVVLSDPQLRAAWWNTLKETAKRNTARIVVPEVVVIEAVANQRRTLAGLSRKLIEAAQREKRFGVDSICDAIGAAIDAKTTAFERELRGHLSSVGATFVPPAAIDHLELVARAVTFRKPWDGDERKDGYRDTLNWLTVIDIAESNAGHEVWWVSQNSKDFGANDDDDNPTKWHHDIHEELQSKGLIDRVNWAHDIASLLSAIAERTAPVAAGDKQEFVEKISEKELFGYVSSELVGWKLEGAAIGLPKATRSAEIVFMTNLRDIEWESLAGDGDGGYVARFNSIVHAGIKAVIPDEDGLHSVTPERDFNISGVASLTRDGSITSVSLSSIEVSSALLREALANFKHAARHAADRHSDSGLGDRDSRRRVLADILLMAIAGLNNPQLADLDFAALETSLRESGVSEDTITSLLKQAKHMRNATLHGRPLEPFELGSGEAALDGDD
ncbi:PIN domain-containing protein [Rhodococcus erythropolis]|uniref:PIN domain-containing protein n=4 Tax=Actinomycetota TaxID=201174 RepID=UPI0033972271